jgi:hypothetical protein
LRSTFYIPKRPIASVERAQAAIKTVAVGCEYAISRFSRGWDNGRFWSHQEERRTSDRTAFGALLTVLCTFSYYEILAD